MIKMKNVKDEFKELFDVILNINNLDDCADFFEDLCTIQELEKMKERLQAAKMLLDNKTYDEIIKTTKISSATLSRVSKCIQYGNGGYKKIINQ